MNLYELFKIAFRENAVRRTLKRRKDDAEVRAWQGSKQELTPQALKRQMIRRLANDNSLGVFVETGTHYGHTVSSCIGLFREIYSIEYDRTLFEHCVRRFSLERTVKLLHGNSAALLPGIVGELKRPAMFWLDAHYSGDGTGRADLDTPICQELKAIAESSVQHHVILIDDARCFDGTHDYPTLHGCQDIAKSLFPDHSFSVRNDVIMVLPQNARETAIKDL
jgi:hypothetical protein